MKFQQVTFVLCILFLAVGCTQVETVSVTATPVPTLELTDRVFVVQRSKVSKVLEFDGRISPLEEVPLYFKTIGFVKQVYVKPGEQVKAGDLLAELEMDDLLNQIAQAEVTLNSAQLLLSEAEKAREQEIALAKINLVAAQTRLSQAENTNAYSISQTELALLLAQEQLTRTQAIQPTNAAAAISARVGLRQAEDFEKRAEIVYKEALDRPWEPQVTRDSFAYELQQAQWSLEIAQAQYNQTLANKTVYQHDLNIQTIAVQQIEIELEQLKQGVDALLALEVQRAQQALDWLEEGIDPALVNTVAQAQLTLERLQGHLANAQIVAPVDGEVVSLSLYSGRPVEPFKAVIIIADPSTIEVSADLALEQMKELVEGQRAAIVLSYDADRTWAGTVRCLPYPHGTCGSTDNSARVGRSARISLEGDINGLKIGTLAQVTIVLEERDDALWLPSEAINTFQGNYFVIMQDGARQRRVDIELGIEGQDQVEILWGLEEGQMVVAP